jgi:predicted nucleotidyltransferase
MCDVHQQILEELKRIEKEEGVRILYACESGSRAWGFPSKDSDYDVRFIYIRPVDWYVSIYDKRDVIERPISDMLDINGWDLRKALNLFRKSNPPLLEWLKSTMPFFAKILYAPLPTHGEGELSGIFTG